MNLVGVVVGLKDHLDVVGVVIVPKYRVQPLY